MRPSFFGSIRGEAIKVSRQLSFWLMLAGAFVLLGITVVGISTAQNLPETAKNDPSVFARQMLEQDGSKMLGTHHTEFSASDLSGSVAANAVRFQSSWQIQGQRLSWVFSGTADGDSMAGVVNMGEYGETNWTAQRHKYPQTRR